MATYHKYVPGNPDEEPIAIPLFGDALSVERANDAQNARVNAGNAWQQLHPCIQEWHKRVILLQVFYKLNLLHCHHLHFTLITHLRDASYWFTCEASFDIG